MESLDDIKIGLEGIGHALSEGDLFVPRNQRAYGWEDKHVNELLQDIAGAMEVPERDYFLGSIVVILGDAGHEVVDGQQRLATVAVLLAAIRDYFFNHSDRERAGDIEKRFLMTRNLRTQELIPKIRLNAADHDFFVKRVLTPPENPDRSVRASKDSHQRIEKAFILAQSFVDKVASTTNKPTDRLVDWIEYIEKRAKVIWVQVPNHANAFTIFETLNDRGLELAVSDLLKNYLFQLAGDRIQEVQDSWSTMLGTLESVADEKVTVDFIRHLWSSKHGLVRERDLYDAIKTKVTSKQGAIDFAGELASTSRVYTAIINTDHELWSSYGQTAKARMETLNMLGMVLMRPLLLAVISKFSEGEVKGMLRHLLNWAVRFIVHGGGGGTLESAYSAKAVEIRSGTITSARQLAESMREIIPTDQQFEASFRQATVSKSAIARYYLRVLEKQLQGDADPEFVPNPNPDEVNLEHVLPQSASPSWAHIDDQTRKVSYRRIGNLALLQSKSNFQAGSDSFDAKKGIYKDSSFLSTARLTRFEKWGPTEIDERQREMAGFAVKAWPVT